MKNTKKEYAFLKWAYSYRYYNFVKEANELLYC